MAMGLGEKPRGEVEVALADGFSCCQLIPDYNIGGSKRE